MVTISAAATAAGALAAVASVFMADIDIAGISPLWLAGPRGRMRNPSTSNLDALDRQRLQIGTGIFGVEHLAVEERLLAARGRRRDVGCRHAKLLGSFLPEILAVDLG